VAATVDNILAVRATKSFSFAKKP